MGILSFFKGLFASSNSGEQPEPQAEMQLPDLLKDFVVIDVETTGLSAYKDEIIQVSAVRYLNGKEADSFSSYIRPTVSIPQRITQITGIRNDTVRNAPPFSAVQSELFSFIRQAPVVTGYNVSFDLRFLSAASGLSLLARWPYFDTLEYARLCYPGLPEYKLGSVCAHIGYRANFHNALNDCRACGAVLLHMCRTSFDLLNDSLTLNCPTRPETPERIAWDEWYENGQIYYVRGEDERKAGNFETAIQYYEKAKECKHVYPFLYNSYAMVYRKQSDYENEIRILEEGISRLGEDVGKDLVDRKRKAEQLLVSKQKANQLAEERAQRREAREARKLLEQEAASSKPKPVRTRPVLQMDDNGVVLQEFPSVASAARSVNVGSTSIHDAAVGIQKHAGGYCWKYKISE